MQLSLLRSLRFLALPLALPLPLTACTSEPDAAGRACFILQLSRPHTCPSAQLVEGIDIHELSTDVHVKADAEGYFPLPETADGTLVLRAAEDRSDLFPSLIGVDTRVDTAPIIPLITRTLWMSYVDAVHLPAPDPTTAIVHVAFPPPGNYVGTASVEGASQVLFNQGPEFVWAATPPGDQTIEFMALGVPVATGQATIHIRLSDDSVRDVTIPVEAGSITWAYLPL